MERVGNKPHALINQQQQQDALR